MGERVAGTKRPTKAQLEAATNKKVRDVIAPELDVLFCGINPGLYSGAVGHHFARPGNRFWPTLELSGFTPGRYSPFDEERLLDLGLGITNIVVRTTARASELSRAELVRGAAPLVRKVRSFKPRFLAVLGVTAFRVAFERRAASPGLQEMSIGDTGVWLLPNPSGLNAHYQLPDLAHEFARLRRTAGIPKR